MTEYFAGANTVNGFYSLFDGIFGKAERLYILKGSSGCGKSTFMKKTAARAYEKGYSYELIRCSADASSLDGIIVPETGVAIVDGTAPHIMDVKYPCVRESIINLGQFWNEDVLLPRSNEIIALTDRKRECFARAYKCLEAYGKCATLTHALTSSFMGNEKLLRFATRLIARSNASKGEPERIFSSAFTKNGVETLPAFGEVKKLCRVSSRHGFDLILLTLMSRIITERGLRAVISLSPTDANSADAVYFPQSGILYSSEKTRPCLMPVSVSNISGDRFFDSEGIKSVRVREKALMKISKMLAEEAREYLSEASLIHGEIERIYIRSMDFRSLDFYANAFLDRMFEE